MEKNPTRKIKWSDLIFVWDGKIWKIKKEIDYLNITKEVIDG